MTKKENYLVDTQISKAIVESYAKKFNDILHNDIIIVGGGPSGLVAAYYAAKAGAKVCVLERKLSPGGGIWGGGMMMNEIIVQDSVLSILDEFSINYTKYDDTYYLVDAVECASALAYRASQAGAKIMNLVTMEDSIVRDGKIEGLVINWSAVDMARIMVDPLMIDGKCILDATGHDAAVITKFVERMGKVLATESGGLEGEKPLWAEKGESQVVENTKEIYPGLFVSGMAANQTCGGQRMGPIFGGMLRSGKKVAELMLASLEK